MVQSLLQCSYRYFREYEGIFRIVWIKTGVCIPLWGGFYLQSCFVSSKLNYLQDLKFDIVYDYGVSLQTKVVYIKFPRGPCYWLGQMCNFYPNFAPPAASQACFFKHFVCRVLMIISRQMKCKTYGIFNSFFNLRVL